MKAQNISLRSIITKKINGKLIKCRHT